MERNGIHESLQDIETEPYKPQQFILQLGAFGTLDEMSDYDRVRSRIEIILFLVFNISYNRKEKGVYNRADVYGKNPNHKEGGGNVV